MEAKEYEEWSKKKIQAIEAEMAKLTSKSDPRWVKLRKQRTSQIHRLNKKLGANQKKSKLDLLEEVTQFLIKQTECKLAESKKGKFQAAIAEALKNIAKEKMK